MRRALTVLASLAAAPLVIVACGDSTRRPATPGRSGDEGAIQDRARDGAPRGADADAGPADDPEVRRLRLLADHVAAQCDWSKRLGESQDYSGCDAFRTWTDERRVPAALARELLKSPDPQHRFMAVDVRRPADIPPAEVLTALECEKDPWVAQALAFQLGEQALQGSFARVAALIQAPGTPEAVKATLFQRSASPTAEAPPPEAYLALRDRLLQDGPSSLRLLAIRTASCTQAATLLAAPDDQAAAQAIERVLQLEGTPGCGPEQVKPAIRELEHRGSARLRAVEGYVAAAVTRCSMGGGRYAEPPVGQAARTATTLKLARWFLKELERGDKQHAAEARSGRPSDEVAALVRNQRKAALEATVEACAAPRPRP